MFKRLQEKWGVDTRRFWIIFIAFALTGTTTAILTRYVTVWIGMDTHTFWLWKVLFRIGMLVFGYQFILLGYGALMGQWAFFWKYEKKLLQKLGVMKRGKEEVKSKKSLQISNLKSQTKIAIFASGAGSNAEKIITYFQNHTSITISLVVCNKP